MILAQETISSAVGLVSLAAIGMGVYNSVKKPQDKAEVADAVTAVQMRELEKTVINLRDNHLHTLDQKLDKHIADQQSSTETHIRQMTRIETILEERLPNKKI